MNITERKGYAVLKLYYLTIRLMTASLGDMPLQEVVETSTNVEVAPSIYQSHLSFGGGELDSPSHEAANLLSCMREGLFLAAALTRNGWNVAASCRTGSSQLPEPFTIHRSARHMYLAESTLSIIEGELLQIRNRKRYR